MIPGWWQFVLLALAAYRVWRLAGIDDITEGLRDRVTHRSHAGLADPSSYRPRLDKLLGCPWCAGFWLSVAVWAVWSWQPHWTLVAAAPFAVSAIVGLVSHNLDG